YLEVVYPQTTFIAVTGSSAKLSCEANYDPQKCGMVHVVWHELAKNTEKSMELTDPQRYFTTVNETTNDTGRRRQVVTEIISVTTKDDGRYQCKATCLTGEQAMGHFVTINVRRRGFA
ncbi:hypothetical protein AMECASPLE_035660, partial [Ameca splendens]